MPEQPRGPDGRWIKGKSVGAVVGAGLVASVMAAAGGGDVTTSIGAGLDAASSEASSAVDQSAIDKDTADSQRDAKKGDDVDAWRRKGLKELKKKIKHDLQCAVQSFGKVQQFFLQHPCDKLDQLLFVLGDTHNNLIVVSVMWVKMPSEDTASQFEKLEDTYGTGDVTPFGTEALELGGIHFTGKHYKSRPDGKLVVVAESEPIRGTPSNFFLKEMATIADVLPPP